MKVKFRFLAILVMVALAFSTLSLAGCKKEKQAAVNQAHKTKGIQISRVTGSVLDIVDSYYEYADHNPDTIIVIWASDTIKNFNYISLDFGVTLYADKVLFALYELPPKTGLKILTSIPEGVPSRGISYLDDEGRIRYFYISESGIDGSLSLVEFESVITIAEDDEIIHDPDANIYGRWDYVFELSSYDFDEEAVHIILRNDDTVFAVLGKSLIPYRGVASPTYERINIHSISEGYDNTPVDNQWTVTFNPETELLRLDGYTSGGGVAYFRPAITIDIPGEGAFDGVITAQVEKGGELNAIIKELRVEYFAGWGNNPTYDTYTLSGAYANSGFTVTLPKTPDEKLLQDMTSYGNRIVSDQTAKYFRFTYIRGYDSDGYHIGNFKLHDDSSINTEDYSGTDYIITFWYVDRDVTVNGRYEAQGYYLNLKKGWNKVYDAQNWETGNSSYTTTSSLEFNNVKWQFKRGE